MSCLTIWLRYARQLTYAGVFSGITATAFAANVPPTMDAIVQQGFGGPEVLKLESVPVPRPDAKQVLVHVYAAGINPVEWRARIGVRRQDQGGPADAAGQGTSVASNPNTASQPQPVIPGGEMAGVIASVGSGVTRWRVGDAVYGRGAHLGTYSQYVLADDDGIAAKPKGLTFAQAAGIPTAGITALLAIKQTGVTRGQTLVIVGAAGGVGGPAVQMARAQGVKVIAIASSRHNPYLQQLGADEIVNYDLVNPADKIRDADAVINLVDGPASTVLSYVRRGGSIILPAGVIPREACTSAGVTCNGMDKLNTPSSTQSLEEINRFVEDGHFVVKVEKTFPLAQAGEAQELDRAGHAEGKVVLITTSAANQN